MKANKKRLSLEQNQFGFESLGDIDVLLNDINNNDINNNDINNNDVNEFSKVEMNDETTQKQEQSTVNDIDILFNPDELIRSMHFDDDENEKSKFEYRPYANLGPNNRYFSRIIFIPNPFNPRVSTIRKFIYFIVPEGGTTNGDGTVLIDSTKNPYKSNVCILYDLRNILYNSGDTRDKDLLNRIHSRENFINIVQIIEDPQYKELEGKFLIYSYGKKIYEKIKDYENETNNVNNTDNMFSTNYGRIFDLYKSPIFNLKINVIGGYNNYDNSHFSGSTAMLYEGKPIDEKIDRLEILRYMQNNVPRLEDYKFKEWDDWTINFVVDFIYEIYEKMSDNAKIRFRKKVSLTQYPYDIQNMLKL